MTRCGGIQVSGEHRAVTLGRSKGLIIAIAPDEPLICGVVGEMPTTKATHK